MAERARDADPTAPSSDPGRTASLALEAAEADADARALASTIRIRILRLCLDQAMTNREIATRLDKNPATTLHHVRTLVDRGFLVAEPVRRGARGSREVPYRATRKSWRSPSVPGQARVLIDTFLEEIALVDNLDDSPMVRLGVRLGADAYRELTERFHDIFQELAAREPDPDGEPYSLFFSMHDDVSRRALEPGDRA